MSTGTSSSSGRCVAARFPAGRVTSNAGAQEHKPATSTINCTVSGTIRDSMDDILGKVHEAGLTLKAGCGIGYEFSTLRPRGAYVSGAGAYTSGPLSFMDIYDKMCFTVSSAGGRRGAQMGTFDVGHPDAMEFVRAKREAGRLRQFNLSLLVTDDFMQAVREEGDWQLAFPVRAAEIAGEDTTDPPKYIWREWPDTSNYVSNAEGLVLCKVYKTVPAKRMWDVIMTSTYDFAEPGFVLIDRVNEMNNNWWCETIRATNPCVTADTRLARSTAMVRIGDLVTPLVRAARRSQSIKRAIGQEGRVACDSARRARLHDHSQRSGLSRHQRGWIRDQGDRRGTTSTRSAARSSLKDLQVGDKPARPVRQGSVRQEGSADLGELLGSDHRRWSFHESRARARKRWS